VLGLRGCHTIGSTLEEAKDRIRQLLAIYFPNEEYVVTDEYGDSLKDPEQR
jgi:predicted RNase H-like HicB family nuclease